MLQSYCDLTDFCLLLVLSFPGSKCFVNRIYWIAYFFENIVKQQKYSLWFNFRGFPRSPYYKYYHYECLWGKRRIFIFRVFFSLLGSRESQNQKYWINIKFISELSFVMHIAKLMSKRHHKFIWSVATYEVLFSLMDTQVLFRSFKTSPKRNVGDLGFLFPFINFFFL